MQNYFNQYYETNKADMQKYFKKYNSDHKDDLQALSKAYFEHNHDKMLAYFEQYYLKHKPEMNAYYKDYYQRNKESIKAARKLYYASHTSQEIAADRARRLKKAKQVVKRAHKYYLKNHDFICNDMKRRYHLAEPKPYVKSLYIRNLSKKLAERKTALLTAFQNEHENVVDDMTKAQAKQAACSIAATRVVNKVLKLRKQYAGLLLKALRGISKLTIADQCDFGEGLHSSRNEPYFYESAYMFVSRPHVMTIDDSGRYRPDVGGEGGEGDPSMWRCSRKCKPLTEAEVESILNFRSAFDQPLCEVFKLLAACDECPNTRYNKIHPHQTDASSPLKGHSFLCYTDSECKSKLRILRVASTHYPKLNSFLRLVYAALQGRKLTAQLDEALQQSDFDQLMLLCDFETLESVFSNKVVRTHEMSDCDIKAELRRPDLEMHIQVSHAKLIAAYKKKLEDYAQHPCCSCHVLFKREYVTRVQFSDKLGAVWSELKEFMTCNDSSASTKTHFMCNYCKPTIKKGKMPPRCVLNGLEVVPIPDELSKLDCLSRQFIQRAKCYQTVVRLGTYTHKVPAYNSLKACKGNMFFLPSPWLTPWRL